MTEEPTDLDKYRGMMAQKETERRRDLNEVQLDQKNLRAQHEELEHFLSATPAKSWAEAAEKMRYLLGLFSLTPEGMDPRRHRLIEALLVDLDCLLSVQPTDNDNDHV
jgi:hypothetical protein